mgnify:CR=1 FL=1
MPRPLNPNNYYGWRKLVLQRDNYSCVLCGSKEELEVDHILPHSTHRNIQFQLENGRTLCNTCHRKTDTYGGKMHKGKKRN